MKKDHIQSDLIYTIKLHIPVHYFNFIILFSFVNLLTYCTYKRIPCICLVVSNDNGYFTSYVDCFFPLSLPRLVPDLTVI